MKYRFLLLFTIIPFLSFSQQLKRTVFDYEKMKQEDFAGCDTKMKNVLGTIFTSLEENNSASAVKLSKKMYEGNKDCFEIYETYGYSLFRSGEWFEGIEIIEKGLKKFGSVPELIKRRSEMSLEMAHMGTGGKNIDGSSVYKANALKYDEEQFKEENYKSALLDLQYLMNNYNRSEEKFYVAKIQQVLKQYDQSNETFKGLLNDEEYKLDATFNIADNYIAQNKYTEAEIKLNEILKDNPEEGIIYEKLSEIFEKKKDTVKAQEYYSQSFYYKTVPPFLGLKYSKANFETLKFFATEESTAEQKIKKLNEIAAGKDQNYTANICLIILKLHANHGNGVEEKATEILAKIGQPTIEKVNKLFQTDVSTCTITNLSEVMATVKNEQSWELMTQYLPLIANMPMTLIPPSLPEKMITFDEDKGVKEILMVVKKLLTAKEKKDDPMGDLAGFGQYVYYSPLKKIDKAKLKKVATELNYSDKEFAALEEKIK